MELWTNGIKYSELLEIEMSINLARSQFVETDVLQSQRLEASTTDMASKKTCLQSVNSLAFGVKVVHQVHIAGVWFESIYNMV